MLFLLRILFESENNLAMDFFVLKFSIVLLLHLCSLDVDSCLSPLFAWCWLLFEYNLLWCKCRRTGADWLKKCMNSCADVGSVVKGDRCKWHLVCKDFTSSIVRDYLSLFACFLIDVLSPLVTLFLPQQQLILIDELLLDLDC